MTARQAIVLPLPRAATHDAASGAELIGRAVGGDPAALQLLYRRHVRAVTQRVTRLLSRSAEAEDVVQDVFVAAFRDLPALSDRARFGAGLMGIAVHPAHRRFRRRRLLARLGLDRGSDDARLEGGEPLGTRSLSLGNIDSSGRVRTLALLIVDALRPPRLRGGAALPSGPGSLPLEAAPAGGPPPRSPDGTPGPHDRLLAPPDPYPAPPRLRLGASAHARLVPQDGHLLVGAELSAAGPLLGRAEWKLRTGAAITGLLWAISISNGGMGPSAQTSRFPPLLGSAWGRVSLWLASRPRSPTSSRWRRRARSARW